MSVIVPVVGADRHDHYICKESSAFRLRSRLMKDILFPAGAEQLFGGHRPVNNVNCPQLFNIKIKGSPVRALFVLGMLDECTNPVTSFR